MTTRQSSVAVSGTFRDALNRAREMLAESNIEDPALESVVLLTRALKMNRVQLYLEFDNPISPEQAEQFGRLVTRRLKGEPAAYIVGHREFYGFDFCVDSNVLIPRPETELIVEQALELAKDRPITTIADIGTGCGAIAISLAHKLPETKIYATDISAAALKVASANCQKHGVSDRICLLEGDLLAPLPEPVDLIVANLPYVTDVDLNKVNTFGFEPTLALSGGPDGLDKIRRLCSQVSEKLSPGGSLLLEIGQGQVAAVTALLRNAFPAFKIEAFTDLAGIGRVVGMLFC
ncbi:MAG: peptide chain release factor N(5)-glutamine methyltransferase [Chloroflexi bacterium]|nr:peptide chain release factor N(5)-glutamine methyltransferase [Chloroflexota bacterium]